MPDTEQTPTEMVTIAPTGETPAGEHAPDAAATLAELESTRKALKAANAEAADRRKKLEAYEQAEEQRKLAEMTEVEKLQAELKRERDARAAEQLDARKAALSHAVTLQAQTLNFHDPADALAFLPADIVVDGVDDALKELARARPYLIKGSATPDIDAGKRSTAKPNKAEQVRQAADMFGIQVYDD